jgi:hypothetical protein
VKIDQVVCAFLLLTLPACVAKGEQPCPQSMTVGSAVTSSHEGWDVFGPKDREAQSHPLRGIAFTDGHPRDRAYLRPTSSREGAALGERTDVYEFSPVSGEGVWMVCQYRETREILFRRIEAGKCEVTSTERADRPVADVSCR